MAFCPKCGSKMADDDVFCRSCGAQVEPLETDKEKSIEENKSNSELKTEEEKTDSQLKTEENKNDSKIKTEEKKTVKPNIISSKKETSPKAQDNKLVLIPIVLGIIGVLVGIAEGLGCPVIFGWDNILTEMAIVIVGGITGIFLYRFREEYFVAGFEFIITGALMVFLIGNMAFIGAVIFIIAGVLSVVLTKKYHADNNLFFAVPISTILLAFVILLVFAASSAASLDQLGDEVSISNVENTIAYSYGFYDGSVKGDISFNKSIEDFSMMMTFYDKNGKVLDSTYPLGETSVEAGKTYQFDGIYIKEEQPYKAQITLKNGYDDDSVFYVQNITLA